MPNYRRSTYGQTFFFTVVTYQRQPFLCFEPCIAALRSIFRKVQASYPFAIDAIVVLPDHLHCMWTLPEGDVNFTSRWGLIKKEFTKHVRDVIGIDNMVRTAHPTDSMLLRYGSAGFGSIRYGTMTILPHIAITFIIILSSMGLRLPRQHGDIRVFINMYKKGNMPGTGEQALK